MLKFQPIFTLLFVMAAITYVKADLSDEVLQAEMKKKFPDAKITQVKDEDQTEIGDKVNKGEDIPVDILNKYQVVFDFTSDGTKINANPPRFAGGEPLKGKPSGTPEPIDAEFEKATKLSVEGVVQNLMGEVASEAASAITKFASGKTVASIEVAVESAGYTDLRKTYNIAFFRVAFE